MTLLESSHKNVNTWKGSLPVASRYTYGIAGERFFRSLKEDGRILGSSCQQCHVTYVPAMLYCERCLSELTEWVDVGTVGEVHSYTLLHAAVDGKIHENPEIIAFVKFCNGGLIHRLGEVDPQSLSIGMHVEAVFKKKSEREGSILDIQYFRPS